MRTNQCQSSQLVNILIICLFSGVEKPVQSASDRAAYLPGARSAMGSGGQEALRRRLTPRLPPWLRLFTFLLVNDPFFGGLA
jgi:hypothetical protein